MFPVHEAGPSKLQCRYCPEICVKFNELIKHEATHHVLPPPPPPPPSPPKVEIAVENEDGQDADFVFDDEYDSSGSETDLEKDRKMVNDLLEQFQYFWEEDGDNDNDDYLKQTSSKKVQSLKPIRSTASRNRRKKMYKSKSYKEIVLFDCSIYNMRRVKIDGKSKFQCLTCLTVLSISSRERLMIHQRTHNPSLKKRNVAKNKQIGSSENNTSSNSVEITDQNRPSKVVYFDCTIYNMERVRVTGQARLKFRCLTCSLVLSSAKSRSDLLRHQRTHQKNLQIQNNSNSTLSQNITKSAHIGLVNKGKNGNGDGDGCIKPSTSTIRTPNDWVDHFINIGDDYQKKMQCLKCDKIISSRPSNLRCHYLIHIGQRPFICNFENCSAAFPCESYLNKHKKRVHGPKLNKSGSSKRFLGVKVDSSVYGFEKVKIDGDGTKTKFKCLTCNNIYAFHSRARFMRHQKSHNVMPSENNLPSNHPNKLENFSNAFSKKSGHFQNGIYSLEKFTNSSVIEENDIEEPLVDINPYIGTPPPPLQNVNDNQELIESMESVSNVHQNKNIYNWENYFVNVSSKKYECMQCLKTLSARYPSDLKRHFVIHNKRESNADDDYAEAEQDDNHDEYAKAVQNAIQILTKDERLAIIKKTLYKNLKVRLTRLSEETVLKYSSKVTNSNQESESIIDTSFESQVSDNDNKSEKNLEKNLDNFSIPETKFVATISNIECNSKPDKVIDNEIAEIIESIEKIESQKVERLLRKLNTKTGSVYKEQSTNTIIINQDSAFEVDLNVNNEKSFEGKNMEQNMSPVSELIHQNGANCDGGNGFPNPERVLMRANSFTNLIEENEVLNGANISKNENVLPEIRDQLINLYQVDSNNELLTNSIQNEHGDLPMPISISNNLNDEAAVIIPEDDIVFIDSIEIENTIDIVDTPNEEDESSTNVDSEEESDVESNEIIEETDIKEINENEILQPSVNQCQNEIVGSIPNPSIFDKRMNTSNVSILTSSQIVDENQEENNTKNNDTTSILNEKEINLALAENVEKACWDIQDENKSQVEVEIVGSIPNPNIFDEKRMSTSNVLILTSNQIVDENQEENNTKNNNDTTSILNENEINLTLAENVEKACSDVQDQNKTSLISSIELDTDANGLVLQNNILTTSPIIDKLEDISKINSYVHIKNSQQESQDENYNSMDVNYSSSSNQEETQFNDPIENESNLEKIIKSSPEILTNESENIVKNDLEINQKVCCNCSSVPRKLMRKMEICNLFKISINLPEVEGESNKRVPLIEDAENVRSFCYDYQCEAEDTTNINNHTEINDDKSETESNNDNENEKCKSVNETTEDSEIVEGDDTNNEFSSVIEESNSTVDREDENSSKVEYPSVFSNQRESYHGAEIIIDSPREQQQQPEADESSESLITIPNSKEPSNIVLDGVLNCVYYDSRSEGVSTTTTNENVFVENLESKTKTKLKAEVKNTFCLRKRKASNRDKNEKSVPVLRTIHLKSIDSKNKNRQLTKTKWERRNSSPKKLRSRSVNLSAVLDDKNFNGGSNKDDNKREVDVEQNKNSTLTNTRSTRSSKSLKEINIGKLGLLPIIAKKGIDETKKTIYRHKSKRIQKRLHLLSQTKTKKSESKNKSILKNSFDLAAYNFEELEINGKPKFKCLSCLCIFSNGSKNMLKGHQNTHPKLEKNEKNDQIVSSMELRRKSSRINKEISNKLPINKIPFIKNTTVQDQCSNEKEGNKFDKNSNEDQNISKKMQNVESIGSRVLTKRNRRIYKSKPTNFVLFDASIYNMKRLKINGKSRFQCLTCLRVFLSLNSRNRLIIHQRTHSTSLQKQTHEDIKSLQIKKEKTSTLNESLNVTSISDQNSSRQVKLFDCSIYNMERVRVPGQSRIKFKCLTCLMVLSEHARERLLKHQINHQRNSKENQVMEIESTTLQNNELVDESENCQNFSISEESSNLNLNNTINEVLESNESEIQTSGGSNTNISNSEEDWMSNFEKIGKQYKCLKCNRNLSKTYPAFLKYHYNTHSGIRPFECSNCSKSFYTNYNLKRHNDRVHLKKKNDALPSTTNIDLNVSGETTSTIISNDLNVSGESLMLKILSEPIQTMMVEGEVDITRMQNNSSVPEKELERTQPGIEKNTEKEDHSSLSHLFPQEKTRINCQQVSVNNQGKNHLDQNKAATRGLRRNEQDKRDKLETNIKHDNGQNFYDWTDDYIKIEFEDNKIKYECTSCNHILSEPSIDALKSHKMTHTIKIPQYKKSNVDDQFGISNTSSRSKRKGMKNESNSKRIRIDEDPGLDGSNTRSKPEVDALTFKEKNYKPVLIEAIDMDHKEIEGFWKNFEIRIAQGERDGEFFAQSLFENFMHDEPINKFIGDFEKRKADFFMRANYYINDNLSLIAYEKLTGKVAAAQLSIDVRKDRELPKLNYSSPTTSSIAKLCHELELKYLGDERCALDLRLTSTTREFRGQGLATEIYKRSINLAQSKGIPMVFGIFSSPITCKITEKLEFEEMFSTFLKDVLNSETGKPYFPNAPQDINLSFRMYRVPIKNSS